MIKILCRINFSSKQIYAQRPPRQWHGRCNRWPGGRKNSFWSMARSSILLVDDDRELDLMLTEYLSAEPFSIVTAVDGTVALDLLSKEIFDLVILDVMLPSLNGF